MMRHDQMILGMLGVAHVLAAIALLPAATFLGFVSIPVIVPGVLWLALLGFLLWHPGPRLRTALRVTHSLLIPLAAILMLYGCVCLRAAQRSAEAGGGLLGAFGLIPIAMGVTAGALSAVSLCAIRSSLFVRAINAEVNARADSGKPKNPTLGEP